MIFVCQKLQSPISVKQFQDFFFFSIGQMSQFHSALIIRVGGLKGWPKRVYGHKCGRQNNILALGKVAVKVAA